MSKQAPSFSPGLEGVIINHSGLSLVNGQEGYLHYRGYSIEDLAEGCTFAEVAYLLLNGELPTRQQYLDFYQELLKERYLDPHLKAIIALTPRNGHPMAVLQALTAQLAMHDPEIADRSIEAKRRKAMRIIAKIPLVVTYFDNLRRNRRVVEPRLDLGHAANYLYMLRGEIPTEEEERIFDTALILHMDHGCNNSTFTTRVVSSTEADIYTACVAAIGSLSGPLHGGANERVIQMLDAIDGTSKVEPHVDAMIANREKIMGFGHRVYKVMDPRAKILKKLAENFVSSDPEMQECMEKANLFMESTLERFEAKGREDIWPNVDFFSGVLYKALHLPTDFFTPVFAISRVVGWLAHHFEQLEDNRIYRPRFLYDGPKPGRAFEPMEDRKDADYPLRK